MKSIRFTDDELNKRIMQIFERDQPTTSLRLSKEQIARELFGQYTMSIDRKIRDAITEIVTQGSYPICATSDRPGYYLARNMQEADQCIAELKSRAGVYFEKIEGIKRGLSRVQDKPVQMGLGW